MPVKRNVDPRENRANAKRSKNDPGKGRSGRPRRAVKSRKDVPQAARLRRAKPVEPTEQGATGPVQSPAQAPDPITGGKGSQGATGPQNGEALQTTPDPPRRKAAQIAHKATVNWKWNKKKRRALALFLEGLSISAISDDTGKHRNTIRRWFQSPDFLEEARHRLDEHKTSKKARRLRTTSAALDRVEDYMLRGLSVNATAAERKQVRGWMYEYRLMLNEERANFGDNVSRVEGRILVSGNVSHNHDHRHTHFNFLDVAEEVFRETDTLHAESAEDAMSQIAARMIIETDVIDVMLEEDGEQMIADELEIAESRRRK